MKAREQGFHMRPILWPNSSQFLSYRLSFLRGKNVPRERFSHPLENTPAFQNLLELLQSLWKKHQETPGWHWHVPSSQSRVRVTVSYEVTAGRTVCVFIIMIQA